MRQIESLPLPPVPQRALIQPDFLPLLFLAAEDLFVELDIPGYYE